MTLGISLGRTPSNTYELVFLLDVELIALSLVALGIDLGVLHYGEGGANRGGTTVGILGLWGAS